MISISATVSGLFTKRIEKFQWALVLASCVATLSCRGSGMGGRHALQLGADKPDVHAVRNDLDVRAISADVWMHTSYADWQGKARTPANGLVITWESDALVVDTTWSAEQGEALIAWVENDLGRKVRGVVITHAHPDRAGGLDSFRKHEIKQYAMARTVELLAQSGWAPEIVEPIGRKIELGTMAIELFHPGAGHTEDNMTVYVPRDSLLFGGCLVREQGARDLGNVKDARLYAWTTSLDALAARYPNAEMVVPGHGAVGDKLLIGHTLALLKALTPR